MLKTLKLNNKKWKKIFVLLKKRLVGLTPGCFFAFPEYNECQKNLTLLLPNLGIFRTWETFAIGKLSLWESFVGKLSFGQVSFGKLS
jgi:hypothetical protein